MRYKRNWCKIIFLPMLFLLLTLTKSIIKDYYRLEYRILDRITPKVENINGIK